MKTEYSIALKRLEDYYFSDKNLHLPDTTDLSDKCTPYLISSNRLIKFQLAKPKGLFKKKIHQVKLTIYDVFKSEIKLLMCEKLYPGKYEFLWEVSNLPHGTYYYELITSDFRKMQRVEI
jgi:hypothetical protein